jgi:hypothetical protein
VAVAILGGVHDLPDRLKRLGGAGEYLKASDAIKASEAHQEQVNLMIQADGESEQKVLDKLFLGDLTLKGSAAAEVFQAFEAQLVRLKAVFSQEYPQTPNQPLL